MFGLTQIPQVVMNIDYKLEPIPDKNVPAYFHDLELNSYAKLLCHFKRKYSLQVFAKTDSRGGHILLDKLFLIIL